MELPITKLLTLVVMFTLSIDTVRSYKYNRFFQRLQTIPTNIPLMTTGITIYGNKISSIPNDIFNNHSIVRFLNLNSNEITKVETHSFRGLTALQSLHLGENKLTEIQVSSEDVPKLKILEITNNQLTEMPKLIGNFTFLKTLYLEHNRITHIDPNYFENLTQFRYLMLTHNRIEQFELNVLPSTFITLSLDHNELTRIPKFSEESLELMYLSLVHNKISEISEAEWDVIGYNYKKIDLSDNPVDRLPNLLPYFDNGTLKVVGMNGRKLVCDNLCWMRNSLNLPSVEVFYDDWDYRLDNWEYNYGPSYHDLIYYDEKPCKSPQSAVGLELEDFLKTFCTDPCDSNPCFNGGTCIKAEVQNETKTFGFRCECNNLGGVQPVCQATCNPSPCENGASCSMINNGTAASCTCHFGYFGTTCHQHPCDTNPCRNGGTCRATSKMDDGSWYHCDCVLGFNGKNCTDQRTCDTLDASSHLRFSNNAVKTSRGKVGDSVTLSCDVGYRLDGAQRVVCGSDGEWSSDLPSCEDCSDGYHNGNGGECEKCSPGYYGTGGHCFPCPDEMVQPSPGQTECQRCDADLPPNEQRTACLECGRVFVQNESSMTGTFTTPNYPQNYANKLTCSWLFRPLDGFNVEIRFDTFELEDEDDCDYDSVQIEDQKYCGDEKPGEIIKSTNLDIQFSTDGSVTKKGFSATYTFTPDPCKTHRCYNGGTCVVRNYGKPNVYTTCVCYTGWGRYCRHGR